MVEFRQKQFGIVSSVKNGAAIGATIGTLATTLPALKKIPIFKKKNEQPNSQVSRISQSSRKKTIVGKQNFQL